MVVPSGFGINGKSYYTNVAGPRDVNLQFTVNSADTDGLGITSLKSNGFVNSVFMHTSQTPGTVNGQTNPNPQSGYALITLKNNFNVYLNGYAIQQPALTSTSTTSLTTGHVYVITALGNTTTANWQSVGFPQGLTPAVGAVFVAKATTSITGTGTVGLPGVPSSPVISMVGTANTTLNNTNIAQNAGAQIMIQFSAPAFTGTALGTHTHDLLLKNAAVADGATTRVNAGTNLLGANTGSDITVAGSGANGGIVAASAGTPAGTIAYAATAPADGVIVAVRFSFDGSSVTVDGL